MYTKALYNKARDLYLKQIKQALADGENIQVLDEYRSFAQEWKQSMQAGISHQIKELPENTRDLNVFNRVSAFDKYRLAYMNDFYSRRDEAIEAIGAAIFYIDPEFSVYRKNGNPELLDQLRAKGLRTGSCLSVENVGICVANLAQKAPGKIICRTGSENYLDIFSNYACFAHYWCDAFRNTSGTLMVILPLERCGSQEENLLNFLMEIEDVTHEIYYPFSKQQGDVLKAYTYESTSLELFINKHGEVLFASKHFEDVFDKKLEFGLPPNISQFMPELSYLTMFFDETRTPCTTREVMLLTSQKKHGFFLAIPEMIHTPDGDAALRCLLQHSTKRKSTCIR